MGHDVYLVGSVPMADPEQVFRSVSAALGSRIKRIPDGETGERGDWITWLEPVFGASPALQKSGEFFRVHASGTGRERYTLRPGRKPEDLHFENLRYADFAKESFAVFRRLKAAGKIAAETKFQIDLVPAHSVIWLYLVDGASSRNRPANRSNPEALRSTVNASPLGRTATSRRSFATSIPTVVMSMATRPCLIELRILRPRRLFGFDGTTGGAPSSPTVFGDPGVIGRPPVTATPNLCESRR